jgi:Ca2+-binding EF-hand superfamily protein
MNLLLAVAYNSYAQQLQYNVKRFTYKRKQSLQIAFKLLDISGDGYIELPEMEAALDELDRPAVSTVLKCLKGV